MVKPWLLYFRSNQAQPDEIPWQELQPLDPSVAPFLIPSLQVFQLGEGASGLTFLELARRHAEATGDLDFVETLALFIAEEQRHSALLGRYLRTVGAPLLVGHWVDGVFRRMRKFAGLECMVTVLVTAEVLAVPYYRAVHRISSCPALRALCRRILREEAQHLLFQASTLAALQQSRSSLWTRLSRLTQHVLLAGTCLTVWGQHGRVLRQGRMSFLSFVLSCRALLKHVHRAAQTEDSRRRLGEELAHSDPSASSRFSNAEHGTRGLADNRIQK